jgi:hypothetical protein
MRASGRLFLVVSAVALAWVGPFGREARAQTAPARAQTSASTGVRMGFGLGTSSIEGVQDPGIGLRGGLSIPLGGANLLTVRGSLADEFALFSSPSISVWDAGVLYGRQAKAKWAYGAVSAGVALTGGMRRGQRLTPISECYFLECLAGIFQTVEYEERPFTTVGIPFEVEAGLTFSSAVGVGLSFFGNINREMSATGVSLQLLIGDLR